MNLVLWIGPKCGQGGRGFKYTENIVDVPYVWFHKGPTDRVSGDFSVQPSS